MLWSLSPFIASSLILPLSFVPVHSLSHVQLFATPWTVAHQASLSFTNSRSLFKLMSIGSVMSSNHLILSCPLLLLFPLPSYLLEAYILSIGYKTYSDLHALGNVFLLLELSIINSLLLSDLLQLILKTHIKD